MKGQIKSDYLVGNGAAQNIEVGFIPDLVVITNLTDGDVITIGHIGGGREIVPFSSGGTITIAAGDIITGATTGATATVMKVLMYSGTFAGGDAAGFFVVEMIGAVAFGSENVYVSSDTTAGINDATVTVNVTHSVSIDTEVATVTTTSAILPYAGSAGSNAKGFTVGAVVAEEAKLLFYTAYRGDQ